MSATTSGRARLSTSEQFSLPQKSASTVRSRAWIWVPIAPSNSSTRRVRVSRKFAMRAPARGSGGAGQSRAHAQQPARRDRKLGAVKCVEMQLLDALDDQAPRLLGGDA